MEMLRAAANAWIELTNPLAGLSVRRAQAVFDFARAYGSPQLQYIYNEIEATDPVLLTCVERRAAAIAAMGWKFTVRAEADKSLAEEQRDALKTFVGGIENFTEALEHLDLAFFRGYSHVQPIWEEDGTVRRIQLLKSWNFLHDRLGETWYWNPEAHATPAGLEVITPDARLVTVTRRRAIDYPALTIYIRHALGERDWGRFVEHYGIPPADITMPPNATEKDKPQFEAAAAAAQNAQNVVLPNGSTVSRASETRGQNPFLDFCNYQAKQILILATGGTLATLAEGDTGTLAGNAQENVWKQIVARDGAIISDAVNRALFRPFLRQAFPGGPAAVDFELGDEKTLTADEVFDLAGKAKVAGWRIAQDELEEASGFTLERDETAPQGGVFGFARDSGRQTPFKTRQTAFKNARSDSDGQRGGFSSARSQAPSRGAGAKAKVGSCKLKVVSEANPPTQTLANSQLTNSNNQTLLEALSRDMAPAADVVKRFLELLESGATDEAIRDQAAAIMRELPSLLPDDPALAAVIRDAITEAYVEAAETELEARATDRVPPGNGNGGQFTGKTNRPDGRPREGETNPQHDRYGSNDIETLMAKPEKNRERAREALHEILRKRGGYVDKAAYRPETGWIRLDWGDAGDPGNRYRGGHGISHIASKHPEALSDLPDVLANGDIYKHEQPGKLYVLHGSSYAVLGSLHGGAKKTITEFNSLHDANKIEFIKKQPRAMKPGENKGG